MADNSGYVYHNPVTTNGVTVGGSNTANQDLGIKVAHSVGTLFGQLLFGFLADRIGRKRMYGIELVRDHLYS
jgi:PHS family inorganic phosphate transporter-like MFS transporter